MIHSDWDTRWPACRHCPRVPVGLGVLPLPQGPISQALLQAAIIAPASFLIHNQSR